MAYRLVVYVIDFRFYAIPTHALQNYFPLIIEKNNTFMNICRAEFSSNLETSCRKGKCLVRATEREMSVCSMEMSCINSWVYPIKGVVA